MNKGKEEWKLPKAEVVRVNNMSTAVNACSKKDGKPGTSTISFRDVERSEATKKYEGR